MTTTPFSATEQQTFLERIKAFGSGGLAGAPAVVVQSAPVHRDLVTNMLTNLKEREKIIKEAEGSYAITSPENINAMRAFLEERRKSGTPAEKALYASMDVGQFVNRLLTKRPAVFMQRVDQTILRDGKEIEGDHFLNIREERNCNDLKLQDYISYDEMQFSARIGLSSPTQFYNSGGRGNVGELGAEGTFVKEGLIVGVVGCRLNERPGLMETASCLIYNDAGKKRFGEYAKYYDRIRGSEATKLALGFASMPTFEEAQQDKTRYVPIGNNTYFDTEAYKRIASNTFATFIETAVENARKQGKKADLVFTSPGTGVWALNKELQDQLHVDAISEYLIKNKDRLQKDISSIEFDWFGSACSTTLVANGWKNIDYSTFDPVRSDPTRDGLRSFCYAWDGNSLPGNEYYCNMLGASGDPAAMCCCSAVLAQNPLLNDRVGARANEYMQVLDPTRGLIPLNEYLAKSAPAAAAAKSAPAAAVAKPAPAAAAETAYSPQQMTSDLLDNGKALFGVEPVSFDLVPRTGLGPFNIEVIDRQISYRFKNQVERSQAVAAITQALEGGCQPLQDWQTPADELTIKLSTSQTNIMLALKQIPDVLGTDLVMALKNKDNYPGGDNEYIWQVQEPLRSWPKPVFQNEAAKFIEFYEQNKLADEEKRQYINFLSKANFQDDARNSEFQSDKATACYLVLTFLQEKPKDPFARGACQQIFSSLKNRPESDTDAKMVLKGILDTTTPDWSPKQIASDLITTGEALFGVEPVSFDLVPRAVAASKSKVINRQVSYKFKNEEECMQAMIALGEALAGSPRELQEWQTNESQLTITLDIGQTNIIVASAKEPWVMQDLVSVLKNANNYPGKDNGKRMSDVQAYLNWSKGDIFNQAAQEMISRYGVLNNEEKRKYIDFMTKANSSGLEQEKMAACELVNDILHDLEKDTALRRKFMSVLTPGRGSKPSSLGDVVTSHDAKGTAAGPAPGTKYSSSTLRR